MLELALSQTFLGLDESKKPDKPTLDLLALSCFPTLDEE
jgi:hypothetical protein